MSLEKSWDSWKALKLIVASVLFVSVPGYFVARAIAPQRVKENKKVYVNKIIQTSLQKEGLKTAFLAQLLGLSADRPIEIKSFNLKEAQKKLLRHPVIESAKLEVIDRDGIYVDYTARLPVALLKDFDNLALDRYGYVFPIKPFFSPKNLPAIYFGTAPFGKPAIEEEKPQIAWNVPIKGEAAELAFGVLELILVDPLKSLFAVKVIDVSKAFSESLGSREIVLEIEEALPFNQQGKTITVIQRRFVRLPVKGYAKSLGNYVKLREKLAIEQAALLEHSDPISIGNKKLVVDLRIERMGYIKEER